MERGPYKLALTLALAAAWVLVGGASESACGGANTGSQSSGTSAGAGADGGSDAGPSSSQPAARFKCCLNTNSYSCPDIPTSQICSGAAYGNCIAACGGDPVCTGQCATNWNGPDASACTPVAVAVDQWCVLPPPPTDCTVGQQSCSRPEDCVDSEGYPLPGYWCNSVKHRCFDMSVSCVGTPCARNGDCAAGEHCDGSAHVCVSL